MHFMHHEVVQSKEAEGSSVLDIRAIRSKDGRESSLLHNLLCVFCQSGQLDAVSILKGS